MFSGIGERKIYTSAWARVPREAACRPRRKCDRSRWCVVTSQSTDGPGAPQSAHDRELRFKMLEERKKKKRHGCGPADVGTYRPGTGRDRRWSNHNSRTNNKKREESEALVGDLCCCLLRYSCLSWSSSVSHSQKAYLIVPSMPIKTTQS